MKDQAETSERTSENERAHEGDGASAREKERAQFIEKTSEQKHRGKRTGAKTTKKKKKQKKKKKCSEGITRRTEWN